MNFDDWFFMDCTNVKEKMNSRLCELYSLARGPFDGVQRFKARKTQNSGVLVRGEANGKNISYYGVFDEIIELQYFEGKRNESFVLASQENKFLYQGPSSSSWSIVLNGHSTYFLRSAIDEDTFDKMLCNENVKGYDRMDKNYEDDALLRHIVDYPYLKENSPLLRDASKS
ncbi:hypothetical protein H5410_014556 [Solanum commersonii]|uniref:Uncharacterized protein n=1 Tax=Solanum commersonii TaxID=4109 RepID=A0A9J5ZRR6_SOLCO|nr:hypothetical protein H5410_014556 [Solanum commersonii]